MVALVNVVVAPFSVVCSVFLGGVSMEGVVENGLEGLAVSVVSKEPEGDG